MMQTKFNFGIDWKSFSNIQLVEAALSRKNDLERSDLMDLVEELGKRLRTIQNAADRF